jgi:hypothetical protein
MEERMKPVARLLVCSFALVCLTMAAPGPKAFSVGEVTAAVAAKQVYTGNIIYFVRRGGSTVTTFRLTLDSFTPEGEVARLADTLKNGGQDALLKAISREKKGTFQIGTQLARDVNAAWISEGPEGERKITALSERWIGVSEARRGTRSLDYPFTFIELFIEADGEGEGGLIPAAKLQAKDAKTWEVENFGIYPARLTAVRQRSR